jgi:dolichyl-phosphate-mannose-protein mannosyltransferase
MSLKRHVAVICILLVIVAAAIVRSSIATSLDSFTYDEAYHIGSGAAYVKTGDFRLNPEQPPLVKLWVGAYVALRGYELSPYRTFSDKEDERDWVEEDAYFHNDPSVLQTRARTAMLALNGLLILLFAFSAWRVFGETVAIGSALFFAIDPTTAAYMPVVMTDLPVALSSGIAILAAVKAFQTWKTGDLALTAISLGLALGAKHSGIITLIAVGVIGLGLALVLTKGIAAKLRLIRSAKAAAVVLGGVIILWGMYGFHYRETPGVDEETFNRPLADKISDVRSPAYRAALTTVTTLHIFPRAYIWGMADTIRAGVEGRAIQVLAFGQAYYAKAPFYFFPGIVLAKLPIGLIVLSLIGSGLLIARRLPPDFYLPSLSFAIFTGIFLIFLMRGSTYAGVRHATPLFPIMAVLFGVAVYAAVEFRSNLLRVIVATCVVFAIVSAVPQMRPWEYFNELAGGSTNGYRYFNDEGVDLSQRIGEAAKFYHEELEQKGELPYLLYFSNSRDRRSRGMDYVGRDDDRDAARLVEQTINGTVMIGANELNEGMWWDVGKAFRNATPVKRLGNLFIFQGTFEKPKAIAARSIFYNTIYTKIYTGAPDLHAGIDGIERSLALDDSPYFVSLELGNQYLAIGDRGKALAAYELSLGHAPKTDGIYDQISEQVSRLKSGTAGQIVALRNPGIE